MSEEEKLTQAPVDALAVIKRYLMIILLCICGFSQAGNAAQIIQIAVDAEGLPFLLDDTGHVWAFRDPNDGGMTQLVQIKGLENIRKIVPYEALDDKGQVFVWGLLNAEMDETNSISQTNYTQATKLLSLSGVTDIAHSFGHGFAVVNGNRIVTWEEISGGIDSGFETGKYGPTQEIYDGIKVRQLAAAPGTHHPRPPTLIALLEDGTVLGWGITEFGQETFRGGERIEFGKFPDAASIALNSRHTAVLTKQGVPLFWGGCDLWGQDHAGKPWIWSHLKKVPSAINDVQSLALDNDALFGSLNSQFDIFLKRDGTVWGAFPPIPQDAPDSECATNINPLTKTFPLIIGDAPAIQASIGNGYVFVLDKKHRLWSWWSWGKRSDAEKRLELIKLNLK